MKAVKSFKLQTSKGAILVQVGQCFRPNAQTKKIFHFNSTNGYITHVMAVAHGVKLSYAELDEAIAKAMHLVGAVLVKEVA